MNTTDNKTAIKKPEVTMHINKSSNFKLIIPREVEKKIRYHLYRFSGREWSGYLFYTYNGSFESDNLVFTMKDFVLLDIGDTASTTFKESPKVIDFTIQHDLLDCKEGLIH